MHEIKLDEDIDLQVLYMLVHEGKFQLCPSRSEILGSPIVNKVIGKVLDVYATDKWDGRKHPIEGYPDILLMIKNALCTNKHTSCAFDKNNYSCLEDKKELVKDMAYPYIIKDSTINKLLDEREEFDEDHFEQKIYVYDKATNGYEIKIMGKVGENEIREVSTEVTLIDEA